jgi:hypothetical protein
MLSHKVAAPMKSPEAKQACCIYAPPREGVAADSDPIPRTILLSTLSSAVASEP